MQPALADGFTLALGGGGGRGWAHIGVAKALDEAGLQASRIVGTSMGAVVGAGLAAGMRPEEIERAAAETDVYRHLRRPGRFAMFDPRGAIDRIMAPLGEPRIEDLPTPLAVTSYDMVTGETTAIRNGPLREAIRRTIAVPLFISPRVSADAVWCDAGLWEAVPVSVARDWSGDPVVGVWVDAAKPWFLEIPPVPSGLRLVSRAFGPMPANGRRLTARSYLSLLAARWAEPARELAPDLLIKPDIGFLPAWHFARVGPAVQVGYEATRGVLGAQARAA